MKTSSSLVMFWEKNGYVSSIMSVPNQAEPYESISFIKQPLDSASREVAIRAWIARKESVCPYAPGLAKFVYLPEMSSSKMEHVYFLAKELKAFYSANVNGKRVGRWMLLPHAEWTSHEQAHYEAEKIFWLLNAAYYHLKGNPTKVREALNRDLPGYHRGPKGEILNAIIGKLPQPGARSVPAKSLFCSALSPLYHSAKFYRYSPYCVMPLVYAEEFQELKTKHPSVSEIIYVDIVKGGLYECFGDDLVLDDNLLSKELPMWGAIIDRVAAIMRASVTGTSSNDPSVQGCPKSNIALFRNCNSELVRPFIEKYRETLPLLCSLVRQTGVLPGKIIEAGFGGTGLYAFPDYMKRFQASLDQRNGF